MNFTNNTQAYNSIADIYDELYRNKDYKKEITFINEVINKYSELRPKNILDVGCGTGTHAYHLSKLGFSVTGVDLSSEMIKKAKKATLFLQKP